MHPAASKAHKFVDLCLPVEQDSLNRLEDGMIVRQLSAGSLT